MTDKIIKLPQPKYDSEISIEKALFERRSIRNYKNEPLTISDISQLLWAAQGITDKKNGFRTAPSAGAVYPLEVYLVVGNIIGLPAGIYKYSMYGHELEKIADGDKRSELSNAALGQPFVKEASIDIVVSAVYERMDARYGKRANRYIDMEAGHAGQNVSLQAVSLGLGTVMVGAFHDEEVKKVMQMPKEEDPLYIIPVGKH